MVVGERVSVDVFPRACQFLFAAIEYHILLSSARQKCAKSRLSRLILVFFNPNRIDGCSAWSACCRSLSAAGRLGFRRDRGRCAAAVYVQPESRQDEGIARFWRKKDGEQFAKLVQLLHFRELAIAKSQSFLI